MFPVVFSFAIEIQRTRIFAQGKMVGEVYAFVSQSRAGLSQLVKRPGLSLSCRRSDDAAF
jgi:hypothetical protein